MKARVVEHPSLRGGRAETRSPMGIVSPFAAVVQSLREGAAVFWTGGSVGAWGVGSWWSSAGSARPFTRGAPRVRQGAAARDASDGQSSVGAFAAGSGVWAEAPGRISSPAASRNGPALDARIVPADALVVAVELHGGAGARRGESSPWFPVVRHRAPHRHHAVRALPPRSFRPGAPQRAFPGPPSTCSAIAVAALPP